MYRQKPRQLTPIIIISIILYLLLTPFIQFPAITLFKVTPDFLLILLAYQTMIKSQTRILLVIALFLSMLGDAVLTLEYHFTLLTGILFFICAHCCYTCLFWLNVQFQRRRIVSFIPIEVFGLLSFYYLEPFFSVMKVSVIAYCVAINLMIFCAFQAREKRITGGAVLFLFSDVIFAINQFVIPYNLAVNALAMSLYYSAQFLLLRGISVLHKTNSQTAMGALIVGCD